MKFDIIPHSGKFNIPENGIFQTVLYDLAKTVGNLLVFAVGWLWLMKKIYVWDRKILLFTTSACFGHRGLLPLSIHGREILHHHPPVAKASGHYKDVP